MNDKIRVMLIDDHNIVRDGLKMLLKLNEDIIVCGAGLLLCRHILKQIGDWIPG